MAQMEQVVMAVMVQPLQFQALLLLMPEEEVAGVMYHQEEQVEREVELLEMVRMHQAKPRQAL